MLAKSCWLLKVISLKRIFFFPSFIYPNRSSPSRILNYLNKGYALQNSIFLCHRFNICSSFRTAINRNWKPRTHFIIFIYVHRVGMWYDALQFKQYILHVNKKLCYFRVCFCNIKNCVDMKQKQWRMSQIHTSKYINT